MTQPALPAHLHEWTLEKPVVSPQSDTTSPHKLLPNLRIDTSVQTSHPASSMALLLQERYLSSEENLSSLGDGSSHAGSDVDYDDDLVVYEAGNCKARSMSISRWDKGRSCDMAVAVSYSLAGRPKVVDLDSKTSPHPLRQQRSASFAALPNPRMIKLQNHEQKQRFSSPIQPIRLSSSASSTYSIDSASSCDSRSPSNASLRPSISIVDSGASPPSPACVPTVARPNLARIVSDGSSRLSQISTLNPSSPALTFLTWDPFEDPSTNPSTPISARSTAHRRLRSISMKLSLANITTSSSKKSTASTPTTPTTPYTPATPQTAPAEQVPGFASPRKLSRMSILSRPKSRGTESTRRYAPPTPAVPSTKMVARAANEREATFPHAHFLHDMGDNSGTTKSQNMRRRKSILSLF